MSFFSSFFLFFCYWVRFIDLGKRLFRGQTNPQSDAVHVFRVARVIDVHTERYSCSPDVVCVVRCRLSWEWLVRPSTDNNVKSFNEWLMHFNAAITGVAVRALTEREKADADARSAVRSVKRV